MTGGPADLADLEQDGVGVAIDKRGALLVADGQVQMDEAPASLMASERFENCFRIRQSSGGWTITQPEGRQSLR